MSGALHDKYEIAHALRETGLLLNVLGDNPYKAKAYLQGAKAIEGVSEDIGKLIREDRLTELSGIGESLNCRKEQLSCRKFGALPLPA